MELQQLIVVGTAPGKDDVFLGSNRLNRQLQTTVGSCDFQWLNMAVYCFVKPCD